MYGRWAQDLPVRRMSMLNYKNIIFTFLLRLPFFIVVYTYMLLLSQDGSVSFLLPILAVFVFICILDTQIRHKVVFALVCVAICAVFAILRQPRLVIATLCVAVHRSEAYSDTESAVWIICLCVSTILAEMIDPSLNYICARNVLITAIVLMLARQVQTLDKFLESEHCRQVSRKTAVSLIRRSYRLTISFLSCILVLGLAITRPPANKLPAKEYPGMDMGFQEAKPTVPELEEDAVLTEIPKELIPQPDDSPDNDALPGVLDGAIYNIIYGAGALLSVYLIIYLLYTMQKRVALRFDDYDEVVDESFADMEIQVKKRRIRVNYGVNYTVRRLFRSKVREYMRDGELVPLISDTPGKLAETISRWEDVETLKRTYHKARYSGEKVTRSEVNALYARHSTNEP